MKSTGAKLLVAGFVFTSALVIGPHGLRAQATTTDWQEDCHCRGTSKAAVAAAAVPGFTSSPFTPPDQKLGTYVVNGGSGLDTGCTFRGGGPLIVRIPVPAVVNPNEIGPDGRLKDPNKLIASGVIGAQVNVRFPVFDIDSTANVSGIAPEIDRISFNDRFIKTLSGINNTWTDDSLVIPISELRFQSENSPNAVNELRVDIDTGNVGVTEAWCMAIDWVAVEFDCAAPYVLAHGINSNAETWDEGSARAVLTTLNDAGVLYTRFSVTPNGSVAGNARELRDQIRAFLEPLAADKVHVIAHSKGGLDTQAMVALAPPFKVLSLSTLSTPHLGSVAADLSIIQQTEADDLVNSGADPNGFAATYVGTWTFGQGPQLPGLRDLTTTSATNALARGIRGNIRPTFTFGADADLNADNDLQSNESARLFPGVAHYAARRAWLVLRDFSSARIVSLTTVPGRIWGTRTVLTYTTAQTPAPEPNDIVVTTKSANPAYGTPSGNYLANHSTIKDGALISIILTNTIPLR